MVASLAALVVGYLFQPWRLWLDRTVHEPLPVTTDGAEGQSTGSDDRPVLRELASGRFVSHEHPTTGSVRVLRLPDGSRTLRIDDLRTTDGPALEVWLAAAPVVPGRAGWFLFDDEEHVDLGALKGNIGDQNYPIPAQVDLRGLRSVAVWCDRFDVSFGAAALRFDN